MTAGRSFTSGSVTDQKRLVRGEQLLHARGCLRIRDGVHHRNWRILVTAGGAPHGEMTAIRELMPKAQIIAVDKDPACIAAAIDAGADYAIQCDLADYSKTVIQQQGGIARTVRTPNPILADCGEFDIISLDLCGLVTDEMRDLCSINRRLLRMGGVFLLTFSYGRDVVERFLAIVRGPMSDDRLRSI